MSRCCDCQITIEAWRNVFWVTGVIMAIGSIFYAVFGSGQQQPLGLSSTSPWRTLTITRGRASVVECTTECGGGGLRNSFSDITDGLSTEIRADIWYRQRVGAKFISVFRRAVTERKPVLSLSTHFEALQRCRLGSKIIATPVSRYTSVPDLVSIFQSFWGKSDRAYRRYTSWAMATPLIHHQFINLFPFTNDPLRLS